jgi:hypothetical protein
MDGLYTKKHQLEALRLASIQYPKLRIGHSYMTLMKYEKNGILQPAEHQLAVNDRNWRFYSGEEIEANVRRVIAYKKEKILNHETS